MNLKEELTSKEYWALPEPIQNSYQKESIEYKELVEQTKIKTVYRLKTTNEQRITKLRGIGFGQL